MRNSSIYRQLTCGGRCRITKTLLVMKLTIFFLLISLLNVSAKGVSQTVNFSGENVAISSVFSVIEKQTQYVCMYTYETLKSAKPVSIKATNEKLETFLQKLFEDQPLSFNIIGKNIFITKKEKIVFFPEDDMPADSLKPKHEISVIVYDEDYKVLGGATVIIKGSKQAAMTNSNSQLTVKVEPGDLLTVSYIGFATQEIKITSGTIAAQKLIIYLKKSVSKLDEVQVMGYGNTSRRLATGNISTVKAEEIERQPVMNVLQALQGKVPGLNITTMSSNSAAPIKIEIRGRNTLNPNFLSEPLYIIDGVPLTILDVGMISNKRASSGMAQGGLSPTDGENPLLFLNPKDIESINVLKDADATAIYGSRGANGVILITTKRGKKGPSRFNFNISQNHILVSKYLDLMNTEEYLAVRREAFRNDGVVPNEENAIDLVKWDQTKYTDWQKVFFGTGKATQITAGFSGGENQTTYNISAGYHVQKDINNFGSPNDRGNLTAGLNHRSINQKLGISLSNAIGITNVNAHQIGLEISTPPNAPDIYNSEGELNFAEYRTASGSLYPFSAIKRFNKSKTNTITTNFTIGYEFIKGLTLSTSIGYNFSHNKNDFFSPESSYDPEGQAVSLAYFGTAVNTNILAEPQLQYVTTIGKGRLSAQLGGSLQTVNTKSTTIVGWQFPNDNLIRTPSNAAITQVIDNYADYKYNAGFARLNYQWNRKYIVNFNARRDGSSRFGPGKRFGNFGSVGLAWIASEEEWFKDYLPSWISFAKLRVSYGLTGSDGVGDYAYLSRWSNIISGNNKIYNYGDINSFTIIQPVNQKYKWESTKQSEIGLDIGLFEDRINIGAAYYEKRTGDQLTVIPTALHTGFNGVTTNWEALVQNKGYEFDISGSIIKKRDWHISTTFNISWNKNKLLKYPGIEYSPYAKTHKIGESISTEYLLRYTGVDPITGKHTFEDYDKNGSVKVAYNVLAGTGGDDRYIAIDRNPKYFGGFNLNTSYKNLNLIMGFTFRKQIGRDAFVNVRPGNMKNLVMPKDVAENHWQQPGDKAKYARYSVNDWSEISRSDGEITDASFIRFSTISLSYNLPEKILAKAKIKSCAIAINTNNLFTITSYKGLDPEIQTFDGAKPMSRIISSSLTFNF